MSFLSAQILCLVVSQLLPWIKKIAEEVDLDHTKLGTGSCVPL